MRKDDAIIVDLDGTLSDSTPREHYLEQKPKDYESFNRESINDKPVPRALKYIYAALNAGWCVIFLTGRDDKWRTQTEKWLKDNVKGLTKSNYLLLMRPTGSFATAVDYKKKAYEQRIKNSYNVHLALDDDPEILQMWKSLGIMGVDFSKQE
jgi:predicted secreted acid phosphatase